MRIGLISNLLTILCGLVKMNKDSGFSLDFDISQVPEDIKEKIRTNIDKWKQAYEKLYQARIQELQERIGQLELELRHNQNWENYRNGLYNFQTYYTNYLSEIRQISQYKDEIYEIK